ncbi:MAG: AbrB/MazE/SpoVT family DNA-binding domain-containing protein [Syntrophobacteraceae bacterium]
MELLKVKRHFQITIPQGIREKLDLAVGDYVQADIEDGKIVIRPVEVVKTDAIERRRRFSREREAAYAILDEIHAAMKGDPPEEIAAAIKEAIQEARHKG